MRLKWGLAMGMFFCTNGCPDIPRASDLQSTLTQTLSRFETLNEFAQSDWDYGPQVLPALGIGGFGGFAISTTGTVRWTSALVAALGSLAEGLQRLDLLTFHLSVGPNVTISFSQAQRVDCDVQDRTGISVCGLNGASMQIDLGSVFLSWLSSTNTTNAFVVHGGHILVSDDGFLSAACPALGAGDCMSTLRLWSGLSSSDTVVNTDNHTYSLSMAEMYLFGFGTMWVFDYARTPAADLAYAPEVVVTDPSIQLVSTLKIPVDVALTNWTVTPASKPPPWLTLGGVRVSLGHFPLSHIVTITVGVELDLAKINWDERVIVVSSCAYPFLNRGKLKVIFVLLCFAGFYIDPDH
jgi:hypothetical protein